MSEMRIPDHTNPAETLIANTKESLTTGLAIRYHRRLAELIDEDIAMAENSSLDTNQKSYYLNRSESMRQALVAEAPLVFRRVRLNGEQSGNIGLEVWKANPFTSKTLQGSSISIAIVDGTSPESAPIKIFGEFNENDVDTVLQRTHAQNEAGMQYDGTPRMEIVPQSIIGTER